MPNPSRIEGDVYFGGNLACKTFTPPAASIGNAAIKSGENITAAKLQHRWRQIFNQVNGSAAAAERRAIFYALTGGTINYVYVGAVTAPIGNSTVTVHVKKNGTTILSSTISLTSSTAAYATIAGTLSVTTFVAGDVLEVVVTVSAGSGTLPQGLFVVTEIDENGV